MITDFSFVPLHVHSQYSILDATASVKAIAEKAKQIGIKSCALTDHGNLFGAVEFYKECKAAGIKPVIGCDLYEAPGSRYEKKGESRARSAFSIVLLAKDKTGYKNLCKLSSCGYLEGFYYYPRVDREILEAYREGLICLVGGMESRLAFEIQQGYEHAIQESIDWYLRVFGENLYLELSRHPMTEEALHADGMYEETWLIQKYQDYINREVKVVRKLLEISKAKGIPYVATNSSHYVERADWKAHEILLNVQSGEPCEIWEKDSLGNPKARIPNPKRKTYPSHEYYFKSAQEMATLFADLPDAISNSCIIAEKCTLEMDFKSRHYPVFVPPSLQGKTYTDIERNQEVEKYLWQLCREGIPKRYAEESLRKVQEVYPDKDPLTVVDERLQWEMSVIAPKGMCDYLLIVWDFIHWAKSQGIPVGPGRGSGAGSIVLYLIGVTDIEPLRFHLFFERFINPERVSYPDIDVDICMDRRNEVIQYTLQKYGKNNVAQIITFGTMKARMAIKDVGRVLSVPLTKVNDIAKLVPEDLNITLEGALEKDHDLKKLYDEDEEAQRIIDIGKRLEGSIRNTGIHAAGLIISGEPLTEFIPVCTAKDSEIPVTQYSMKPVELVGMLKIDFLGLKTLTAIQYCVEAIAQTRGKTIDWVNLPLDNRATFDLLNQGKTMGIFQLESGGMQDLARQLHLDLFEEIIAVGALYRPGPMDMIPSFINRKHGREPIEYDHEWLKDILSETYGIMVYQEQVMQIASKLARYSLGEGDVLRRAMGKKDRDEMMRQREKFRSGALANGIDEGTAITIFDKMEKFASYGFNKSHAAAYGYLSYVTAYLKANYPKEWMASLLTCDSDDISKVAKFINECQSMDIKILPPDINEAEDRFVATEKGIRFAMSGIKGIGGGVVEAILVERKNKGPYISLYQFIQRIDKRTVGKKAIESLIDAGCFDFTEWSRDELKEGVEAMYDAVLKTEREEKKGVMTFFAMLGDSDESRFSKPPTTKKNTTYLERLKKEKELLGFFLTGHPMDSYRDILTRLSNVPLSKLTELPHDSVIRCAFIIESVETKISAKSQKKFAILKISDGMEHVEIPVWADLYEEKQPLLVENQLVYAVVHVENQDSLRLSLKWLDDLTKADEAMIHLCDEAYDRAKHQILRMAKVKAAEADKPNKGKPTTIKSGEKKMKPTNVEKPKIVTIGLDIEKVRMSEILFLKKLFASKKGSTGIRIDYFADTELIAHVHIGEAWGIDPSAELQKKVRELSSCLSFHMDEQK
jgi:DNA polymerase-3 subunit alpha